MLLSSPPTHAPETKFLVTPINQPSDAFWVVPVFAPTSLFDVNVGSNPLAVPPSSSLEPFSIWSIIYAVSSFNDSIFFGTKLWIKFPYLSSILEIKNGSVQTPLFIKVLYAPTKSIRETSPPAPRQTAGTGSKSLEIPSFFA